ncbi:MAG: AAA family ATPase [Candidatus Thermoplasmatota archaeon]|jgi:CO dehydrogenase maturation factor|uniref:ATP-binding protein n=1 Tax=Ferroplasma sp. TaxID=2591003 RepID=UPI0026277CF2|nr:AAA family ATPase [Ferroplasma sp.]MCL4312242.1 AAA family ATPase [Candidatus Thermoplasmatota archaeon]
MDFTLSNEVKRDEIVKKLVEGTEEFAINRPGNRIVITGKGGTGKTTITAILSYLFAKESHVLAVDADPQMNLPYALGMKKELAREIVPLNRHVDYIEEKTGARPGSGWGEFLSLNPDVSDVVDRFGIDVDERISLLVMGTLHKAAIGCLCPENDLLDSVVRHISLRNDDVILMDTEAGVEHFGRAIAKGFGHAIVVSDVSFNSVQVADSAIKLAWDLGIQKIHLVFNRVGSNESSIKDLLKEMDQSIPFTVDYIPYDDSLGAVDPSVTSLIKNNTTILPAVEKLLKRVQNSE